MARRPKRRSVRVGDLWGYREDGHTSYYLVISKTHAVGVGEPVERRMLSLDDGSSDDCGTWWRMRDRAPLRAPRCLAKRPKRRAKQ